MSIKLIDATIDFIDHLLRQSYQAPGQVVELAFKHFRNFNQELAELSPLTAEGAEVTPIEDVLASPEERGDDIPTAEQLQASFQVQDNQAPPKKEDLLALLRTPHDRKVVLLQTLILRELLERPVSLTNEDLDTHPRYRFLHDTDTELL